ncbi:MULTISPECIES: HXXEE domain-containing protein [Kitasatospora]|uniref:HXXEE domain-containing protein n=1 Tax=Kitasatospora cystarginea TaxID=58350 RepID=A0ABN3E9H8_9ACTN
MVSKKVTWGLLLAWAVNDAEEWFTMAPWSRRYGGQARGRVPGPVWLRREISPAQARTAISLMGVIMLAASADGDRTAGRSRFFQAALAAFGLHGVGHLALSARHRGYTPGVVTAPTVVLPFSLWAWRELGRAGVRRSAAGAVRDAAVLLPASLAAVHLAAGVLTGEARRRGVNGRATSRADRLG